MDKGCGGHWGVGYWVGLPKHRRSLQTRRVRGVSNREWIILLNGSMKVLGIPLAGDEVGYLGGGSLVSGS